MVNLIPLMVVFLIGLLIYKRRFTSKFKFAGMYFIQLYYLLLAPVCGVLFLNIGLEIIKRPAITLNFMPDNLLFDLYFLALLISGIGVGVHSTSTTVYQSFKKGEELEKEAFISNELFHGPFSHNMIYLGSIAISILLALLEINHPDYGNKLGFNMLMGVGIAFGITETIAILWSTHIGYPIIGSFIGIILVANCFKTFATNVAFYPLTIVVFASLITLFSLLFLTFIIFAISGTLSKKVISRTFPKGHSLHTKMDLKILTIKIERDLAKLQKQNQL